MVATRREEVSDPASLTDAELANIIDFVRDAEAHSEFCQKDTPDRIQKFWGNTDEIGASDQEEILPKNQKVRVGSMSRVSANTQKEMVLSPGKKLRTSYDNRR